MSNRLEQSAALRALFEDGTTGVLSPVVAGALSDCILGLLKEAEIQAGLELANLALDSRRLPFRFEMEVRLTKTRILLNCDRNQDAAESATDIIRLELDSPDSSTSMFARSLLAFSHAKLGRADQAISELMCIRDELLQRADTEPLAQAAANLSAVYVNGGQWLVGSVFAMEAIVSGRRCKSAFTEGLGWINHGQCMRGLGRWSSAIESMTEASRCFALGGWKQWELRARHSLALVHWKQGRLQEASVAMEGVMARANELISPISIDYARLLSGLIQLHGGDFAKATKTFDARLCVSRSEHPRPSWLCAEYAIDVFLERGEFEAGIGMLDVLRPQVVALAPRGDVACEIQRRRAECLLHLGKVESGLEAVREAESIARECGDVYELACSLRVLGLLLARAGKPVDAQGAFAKAFQIFDEIQTPYEWGKLWVSYGDWLCSAHSQHYFSFRAARDAYRAAIEHFDGMRSEYKLSEAHKRLAELEERLKEESDQATSDSEIRPRPRRRPVRDIELQRRMQWAYETFGLVTRHKAFLDMLDQVAALAPSDIPVLVLGESGTGKERIAHGIHQLSGRTGDYVAINCSAIQPTMLEAELFGYVRGAFTGADRDKPGLFESADRGTVFLDEIGEMSVDLQAKLLRFLENGSLRRIGATQDTRVRVRLLAATNREQSKLASGDGFRSDLYFRLAHAVFTLPPLRERGDDAEVLIDHFLEVFGEDEGKRVRLSSASRDQLLDYMWPGNVRQLRSLVHRLVAQSKDGQVILPRELQLDDASAPRNFLEEMEEQERKRILDALEKSSGVKADAARMLRLSRTTMLAKMKRYKIPM